MSRQAITVELPDEIYERIRRAAKATRRPVEQVVVSLVKAAMPPLDRIPPQYRPELEQMESLSDEELWKASRRRIPPHHQRRIEALLQKNQQNKLTERERERLTELSREADRLTFCRSYAYLLLKQRGHRIPALRELKP